MKLATFQPAGQPPRVGVAIDAEQILDVPRAAQAAHKAPALAESCWYDLGALLQAGERGLRALRELVAESRGIPGLACPLSAVRLLPPLPNLRSLRDCLAFERHLIQATETAAGWRSGLLGRLNRWTRRATGRPLLPVPRVWYEQPIYYKGNPRSLVGHDAPVRWPAASERLDFELEVGMYIGRQGANIPEAEAADFIAGYTIFNDFSARDLQLREMQGRLGPAKGKDFDTGNAMGPFLVTRDEVPDVRQLTAEVRVNGARWSQPTMRELYFSPEQIIAHLSRDETLYPGDFVGLGTMPDGCGLELDRWLRPGDVVELEVEQLGCLRNHVVA